jgi:alpha-tubulin suppressor-like RCC1 family protein
MSYDWGSGSSNFLSSEYVNNKLAAGLHHTCAILDNGSLMCWGRNQFDQLGNGTITTDSEEEPVLVDLPSGRTAVAVSAGNFFTCALLDNGSVMCWGTDGKGQLGNGATTVAPQNVPVLVDLPTGRSAVGLSVGGQHSCAILDTGSLMCWGFGGYGQLGNDDFDKGNEDSPVYVNIPYGRTAVAVSVGTYHTCAILDNGSLMCWGRDQYGQLGEGAGNGDQVSPVYVDLPTGRTAVSIVAAFEHSCAILDNGSLMCWGRDDNSKLGNGAGTSDQQSPDYVDLPTGLGAVAVDAGDYHTCAILDNESTYCWGSNVLGGLGIDDPTDTDQASPVHVDLSAGRTAVAISRGQYHACAILDNKST